MRYEDQPYKQCGITKNGVRCEVLIPQHRVACSGCAKDLLAELERMAGNVEDVSTLTPERK